LKFSQGPIRIDGALQQEMARVTVLDGGVGVQPQEAELIFEKFYRGTTPMAVPGSGLGLNICRGVIELHHGQLGYEPAPGGGSRFSVALPLEAVLV